ncbi:MAG: hypothetical protein PVI97_10275 [Candidatus Thiodiazotropha sp.]|jgi:hypothetical protein
MKYQKLFIKIPLVTAMFASACVSQAEVTLTTGYDRSEGTYGSTTTTTIDYATLSLKYQDEESNWRFKFTLPRLSIEGDGVSVDGSGNVVVTDDQSNDADKVSGLGDVVFGTTYKFPAFGNHLIDGTLKVKLPTADSDEGLGTGKTDFIYQLDYAYAAKSLMPFATIGYKKYGQPEDYTLNSVKFGAIGGQINLPAGNSFGMSWNYQEAATETSTEKRDVMGYVNFKLSKDWNTTLYGIKGSTESSVDREVGLTLSVKM